MSGCFNIASLAASLTLAMLALGSGRDFAESVRAAGSPIVTDEYGLKAAFLFNLAKFVDWPAEKLTPDNSPLVILVAGEEGFARISAVIHDKTIDKHKVIVQLLKSEDEINKCHILFITRGQKQREPEMTARAGKAAALTVGEHDKFLEAGGMVRFYLEADNLRLEIADGSVRQAGLSIKASALSALINKGIARVRRD